MDYRKTAEAIYEKVGKRENLVSVAHCSTRLRLVLADDKKCDAKAVEDIDGVKGVFSASGQLQVILGTGVVNKVYDEFLAISGMTGVSLSLIHISEPTRRTPISYAVFCLRKKT